MHITINKTTKNNSHRKESISGTRIDFGAGHSTDFWWKIHFNGKDKNNLSTVIDVQMTDEEHVKFIEDFSIYVENFKKYINEKPE